MYVCMYTIIADAFGLTVCMAGDHAVELEGGGVELEAAGRRVGPAVRATRQSQSGATRRDRGVRGEEAGIPSYIHTYKCIIVKPFF